jgi:hypothetical protein
MNSQSPKKPATGLDADLHFRIPSDLLPRLHMVARSRGLCAAAFARSVLMEAVDRASWSKAA